MFLGLFPFYFFFPQDIRARVLGSSVYKLTFLAYFDSVSHLLYLVDLVFCFMVDKIDGGQNLVTVTSLVKSYSVF